MGANFAKEFVCFMDVLKKINKLRLDRDWSVYKLSVESGVSQSTLTNMFNRETLPSITTLESICAAFSMTMSEFFEEEADEQRLTDANLLQLYHSIPRESQKTVVELMQQLKK